MSVDEVARRLDEVGITLVNYLDPEEGNKVPCIDWREAEKLLDLIDESYREGRNEGAIAVALANINQSQREVSKRWWRR